MKPTNKKTEPATAPGKIKLTYKELFRKLDLVNTLIKPDEEDDKRMNKLKYAIQKHNKNISPVVDVYNEKIKDFNVDFASVDKNENLIKDIVAVGTGTAESFKYTKENDKKRREKVAELMNEKVEIEPHMFFDEAKIATLDEFLVEELRGFFFPAVEQNKDEKAA